MLDAFGEMKWLSEQIPGIRFLVLDVDSDEIVKRSLVRNRAIYEAAGTTVEAEWNQEAIDLYGPYSEEAYEKATRE